MSKRKGVATAAELRAMPAAYRQVNATANPDGNRAQRRAWAKHTKNKMPGAAVSAPSEPQED